MRSKTEPLGVAEAHASILRDLYNHGVHLDSAEPSRELLGYQTGMSEPRRRLVADRGVPQSVIGSVARFVWLIAGSDRLEDIAYYEDRVRHYTDDKLTVPGSSYGRRLFLAAPGLNQIEGVVTELKNNPASRRAAAVVWLPEDAVRQGKSKDIPCTFGLFFHIREHKLIMTTVMRSNNAVTLLPYNFFEFSMVGEMIATELGVPFDRYVHWAASMHTFDKFEARARSIIESGERTSMEMPPMPEGATLCHGYRLAQLEAQLRHASHQDDLEKTVKLAHAELPDYWLAFFNVIYAYGLAKRNKTDEALTVARALPAYFREGVIDQLAPLSSAEADEGALFGLDELDVQSLDNSAIAASRAAVTGDSTILDLTEILANMDDGTGAAVTVSEMRAVIQRLQSDFDLAARGGPSGEQMIAATLQPKRIQELLAEIRSVGD